jgi:DNA helicase-4
MFTRLRQRITRRVERAQYSAIQLVSIKRSYLERRDKNRFRELVEVPKEIELSTEQLSAATSHAKETLVVAGAGSGKTFVLVGRAKYLVNSKRANHDKVLMLAYNKDAADELSNRTKASGIEITAKTFHSFGLSVVNVNGQRTGVTFGEEGEVSRFLSNILHQRLDQDTEKELAKYFSKEIVPTRPFKDFKDLNDYSAYVRATIPRTLNDQVVKSHGEWLISNFLFVNQIDFKYEELYNCESPRDRHRPDFVVAQKGKPKVWIEYFGIDRFGGVAPGINAEAYKDGIQWKKSIHKKYGTELIDLYFHELLDENLIFILSNRLKAFGYELRPMSSQEILEHANKIGYQSRFLKICEQFLGHVRARRLTSTDLTRIAENSRDRAFVQVFKYFLDAYEKELENRRLPDFAELIHGAADRIESGDSPFEYSHVLVDEFQDISADRSRLIKAMQIANPKLELTCVGDDWQSIYRFSGSDVSIMRDASKPKRHRKRVDLTNTYRLPQKIADISREFILKNPLQLEKKVVSQSELGLQGEVIFHWDTEITETLENIRLVIDRIGQAAQDPSLSLRVLARYRSNLPKEKELEGLWEGPISVSSIHAAKGLEADYVIVTDLIQDFRGFPSTIEDDPVMRLVMPEKDLHEHGEERRLFYVALTRAIREVHLISPIAAPSLFTTEMFENQLGKHYGVDSAKNSKCPVCTVGRILVSINSKGSYCSNTPLCDFRAPKCMECEKPMVKTGDSSGRYICLEHPEKLYRDCYKCDWGVLIPRTNSYTKKEFLSCHTWSKTRCDAVIN